ncbi:MAG: thiol-disulfide isomerase [Acidobacteriota bacterium]
MSTWTALLTAAVAAIAAATVVGPARAQTSAGPSAPAPTFVADVAPILHRHCITCHRSGEMAPMALITYADARPWATSIRAQVAQRRMPPWFADPAVGHFRSTLRLADADVATITRWVDSGAKRGEGPEPQPPPTTPGWRIGKPDLELQMAEPFNVPAQGLVDYQYIRIPTNLKEDRWIQAIEIHPTDRRAVHHLRVFALAPGENVQAKCPGEVCGDLEPPLASYGENIGSVTVGTQPIVFPPGTAKLLKAGSVLTLHTHYVTTGTAVADRTRLGFIFAKTAPRIALKTASLAQEQFAIPPGAANYPVQAALEFKTDGQLWSLGPHTHVRGKSWRFDLVSPRGERTPLLLIPRYDFNWQMYYDFAEPVPFTAGSRLEAIAAFDNSVQNKANPDPRATVRWGEQTKDEMMFASVTYSTGTPAAPRPKAK